MNLLIWVFLALVTWPNASAMYYTKVKEVFRPPTNRHLGNDSYFGYSIAYDKSNKKLVISAPTENNIGEVYNCNIENKTCTPIINNIHRDFANYTHDYWFGATVKAGPNFVMMCAPRYTEDFNGSAVTHGKCYSYADGVMNERRSITETERLYDLSKEHITEKSMDSFGWSIDIAGDNTIIVGGPGMYHGRVMIYEQLATYKIPKLIMKSGSTPEMNFGYAVASGKFINNELSYAVGSPYGTNGYGEVAFYKGRTAILTKLKMDISQVGSMFGAVLCAASLSGKRTDLLVGAPAYATKKTYNLGAVYVYLAGKLGKVPKFERKIVSEVSGSMFGSAIINVGDLNGDEKHEIAISAPFEKDGHGVVYLYSGADLISKERNLKYLQKIEPETSYGESFGMSLTTLLDYDKNGCQELAIGSPYINKVVLLRCMAAVVVVTSEKFPYLQDRTSLNKTDFEFEVCLSVKYPRLPKQITAVVSTTVEMNHDYAKLADTNSMGQFAFNTSLEKNKPEYCTNVSFILPIDGKYETKISYTISSQLLIDPGTLPEFNSSRVILSDRSLLAIQNTFWAAECAGAVNKTCVSNLMFTPHISFQHDDDLYTIGSSTEETMHMTVHNYGDIAYEPCVRVHTVGANVLTSPSGCVYEGSPDENRLKCEPLKPIRNNTNWITGQIVLEMTHLTNLDKTVTITMFLFNRCEDVATENISIPIPVKADPRGIIVKGETDIGTIVKMTKEDIEKNGKKMQHIYKITNKGPTNWKRLQILVTLHSQPYIKYGDTPVTVYLSTSNLYPPCPLVSKDETSMNYLCLVQSLMKKVEFANIIIPMHIVPGTLDGILEKDKNVTIVSSVKLKLIGDDFKVERITTTITLLDAMVPIEMIIIAVIVGLCIIIIIALIFYWVGFLRRKKREELKQLKKRIKRQTILRRSTMSSQAPQAEDQKEVLEGLQEEDEQ